MKRLAVLLALAALARPAEAQQYFYLPFKMLNTSADPFPYYVDARSSNPVGLVFSDVQAASLRAWKQWDDVSCAATAFASMGPTTAAIAEPRDPYDVYNVSTIWIASRSDPYYEATIGSSDVTAITIPLTYAGVLKQCDIYMNGAERNWSTAATTPSNTVDVESIVLHEVGHCQGLDHTYTSSFDVMYASPPIGSSLRTLSQNDTAALCNRYPTAGSVGSPCAGDGGCGGNPSLKCVSVPKVDGGTGKSMCTIGCPTGQNFSCDIPYACLPSSAFSPQYNGACLPPGDFVTQVGKPCTDNVQCGSTNGVCFRQNVLPSGFPSWQDGYCSQDCGSGQPQCPAGASCIDTGGGVLRCLKQCRIGYGDCRPGYSCVLPSTGGSGVCVPSCHGDVDCNPPGVTSNQCRVCDGTCLLVQNPAGQVGDPCSSSATCGTGQACGVFSNSTVGICTQSCARACTTCPAGSTCHPVGLQGELYCLRNCTGPGTCPSGLQCGILPTGTGCVPPCRSIVDCPVGTECVSGQCQKPTVDDAGCALCNPNNDAGRPTDGLPRDAGVGPGGSGGCGCGAGAAPLSLAALLSCAIPGIRLRRRR
ncbi:MAG: matrixin family metalloprotease [Myxococcales bacterium]|nr:matrixin family metalloprotease [Myxococcales bacterium]